MNPPAPLDIGPHLLLADGQLATSADATSALPVDVIPSDVTLQTEAQALLDYSQTLITGDELMFIMDVPYVPAQETPIVLAQAATPGAGANPQPDYILNACKETESTGDPMSAFRAVNPVGMLVTYLINKDNRHIDLATETTIKPTLLEGTKHGNLVAGTSTLGRTAYRYDVEPNYIGNDRAVFMAEFEGKRYKIVVNLVVTLTVGESPLMEGEEPVCPPPKLIKVNGKPVSGTLDFGPGYTYNSVSVTFSDLAGAALGQTTGTSITLDDKAAGHSWFIDTTPGSNEEFLPTSNPYEWVAKEGSAAYGKMDMLSVLLHEYGHALGIDHSADGHDYMATTLTAGVRRMPSAEELALMQQLISGVKDTLSPTPLPGGGEGQNGPSQLPLLPLGGFGLAFLGRLRSSRYGSLNVEADLSTLVTQFAVTANAKLTNGNFSVASGMPVDNGWSTQGSVDFTGGAATLKEVSTSQTRLNQVFVVNPRDRFLSFTIAGSVLDDVNGAPDDAFEVALLDANTGLSLAGAFSLTHTDAMLNLQANATETAASSVTRVTNADGSRTYRVDLAGIAVGTAVNLSFDLVGFGKSTSEVTVRDVRVSGLPELQDDAATMNEDGTLAVDPFAQVDNAALLQLGSHVVDQPAHGTVTVNTDGTFAYTPAADYFGTDSFTYRLNDGPLESNLATVTVSIAAVNDAPVAGDVYATLNEDTPLQITLGAHATDVENSPLTIQIVADPSHGVLVANADGSYTYTPEANYNGADSFTYVVNDGELDSNLATVSLTVDAVNDAPEGMNNTVTTLEDTPYVFQLADFGYSDANDFLGAQASRLHADGTSAIPVGQLPRCQYLQPAASVLSPLTSSQSASASRP